MQSESPAVEITHLGKHYQRGILRPTQLTEWRPSRRGAHGAPGFWALSDVSFDVAPGEVFGIIGSNGAGKSTLLKILARITPPTRGSARIRGRVASLLEIGTGFHPELTGRENIFLSAAILGMNRGEIKQRFDRIVDFAGIGDFLDTPVKRYSSGMFVRLGFAVAAHVDAEVLLVDEVLAVGDAEFRRRCLGRLGDITSSGRTALLVSHDMSTISQICSRAILLESGRVASIGDAQKIVSTYLNASDGTSGDTTFEQNPEADADFLEASVRSGIDGHEPTHPSCDDPIVVNFTVAIRRQVPDLYAGFYLRKHDGTIALYSDSRDHQPYLSDQMRPGNHAFSITIPARLLAPATYGLTLGLASISRGQLVLRSDVCSISIHESRSIVGDARPGAIGTLLPWDHLELGEKPNV